MRLVVAIQWPVRLGSMFLLAALAGCGTPSDAEERARAVQEILHRQDSLMLEQYLLQQNLRRDSIRKRYDSVVQARIDSAQRSRLPAVPRRPRQRILSPPADSQPLPPVPASGTDP